MKKPVFGSLHAVLFLALSLLTGTSQAAESRQVNILLVAPAEPAWDSHRNGAIRGETEANIQGRFLNLEYRLNQLEPAQAGQPVAGIAAVVVAAPRAELLRLRELYAPLQVPVINIADTGDALREQCLAGLYHTIPSDGMLAAAEAQWRQANPGAEARAMAWHSEFVKFAGRDLNKRYTEQFGLAMDSAAWSGWAAVRMLAEAVVRTNSTEAAVLDRYLREELAFDGQKGVPQTFHPNGQMRQPLLITDQAGVLLGEAPVRGVAAADDLDSLGLVDCR